MPFFRFHFVEASRLAVVSRKMTDRIGQVVGCPREHIVLEAVRSVIVGDEGITAGNWPFVEVEYFERPKEIEETVAGIVSECLREIGYADSDVYFRYLCAKNYYENGVAYGK